MAKNLWSHDVTTHWSPPEGFFKQSAEVIAKGLKMASDSKAQALDRLDFYINRAGSNLTTEDEKRLEAAKGALEKLYGNSHAES